MTGTSTYALSLGKMASLFAMGTGHSEAAGENGRNEGMASLLRQQLTAPLPKGTFFCDVLVMVMSQMSCDTRPLAGRSLGDLLMTYPESDLGVLTAIKESSKQLSTGLDSEVEKAMATTLYYAALASALVFHNKRITQNSYEKLDESFAMLIETQWMAEELTELFLRAKEICASRRGKS